MPADHITFAEARRRLAHLPVDACGRAMDAARDHSAGRSFLIAVINGADLDGPTRALQAATPRYIASVIDAAAGAA